jgi:hypothetical protein
MPGNESEEVRLLREIARWTREAALPTVRPRVEAAVDTDAKKRVYHAIADGLAAVRAIEKTTGVNHSDIRKWLLAWKKEGIIEPDSDQPKAMFTLRELGIPVPEPTPRAKKNST